MCEYLYISLYVHTYILPTKHILHKMTLEDIAGASPRQTSQNFSKVIILLNIPHKMTVALTFEKFQYTRDTEKSALQLLY